MKTSKIIRASRKKKGLTQRALAKELGFTAPQFVSNWERGAAVIPKRQVLKVSSLLGIPKEELINAFKQDRGEWAWEKE